MKYSRIAELGRAAAFEKVAQRSIFKSISGTKPPKVPLPKPPKRYTPKGPLTSGSGELRPGLKRIADQLGIPPDEYLNIMRGHMPGSILPSAQRTQMPAATPDSVRSAVGAGLGTAGAVGGGAAAAGGYGPGGEKSNELIEKYRQWVEPLNRLLRGAFSGKE